MLRFMRKDVCVRQASYNGNYRYERPFGKDWIIEYSILEIKALYGILTFEIKEVASRTNFQSNSVMTRFFFVNIPV